MEVTHLLTVVTVLILIAGWGLGVMVWAYQGAGSVAFLFSEVMPVPAELSGASQQWFQAGIAAYIRGRYRRAIARFTRAAAQQPPCGAAIHNIGLAWANLRQDDKATTHLLQAAELYHQANDPASIGLVKQQLGKLRSRKLARESRAN
jgi:tetratricopeptide (TPR) repeat protein